jgi:hypothetical protein
MRQDLERLTKVSLAQVAVCTITHTRNLSLSRLGVGSSPDIRQRARTTSVAGEVSGMIFLSNIIKGMKVTHDSFDFDDCERLASIKNQRTQKPSTSANSSLGEQQKHGVRYTS